MAEDWDLEAVVRGCKSATDTTTTSTAITAAINSSSTAALEEEMSLRDWVKAEAENDPFSFPNLVEHRYNAFQELQQFYMPFYSNPTINNNTTTSYGIIPNPPIISDFGGSSGQHHLQQQQQHHFLPTNATIRPPFNPGTIPVSNFGRFQEQQQQVQQAQQAQQQMLQQNQIQPQNHPQGFAAPILPTMQLHPPRSRKRKSQQKRLVCQVKVENLSADLWAWRKYGQKPIKGSPHPRNYYRCSSTKGCAARKQVERSTTDPDIFIVTYSGDHTHPRPTHRNSLAGSTRNKLSSAATTSSHNKPSNKDFNSSSPLSASSSLSPTAQMTPPLQADQEVDYEEMVMDENENEDEDEDEDEDKDDILIPNNTLMSDDIFMGLHQLETNTSRGTTGTSAANFSNKGQPNLASSWAASHSSSAGATVGGGF